GRADREEYRHHHPRLRPRALGQDPALRADLGGAHGGGGALGAGRLRLHRAGQGRHPHRAGPSGLAAAGWRGFCALLALDPHDGASQNNMPSLRPLNGYSRSSGSYVIGLSEPQHPGKLNPSSLTMTANSHSPVYGRSSCACPIKRRPTRMNSTVAEGERWSVVEPRRGRFLYLGGPARRGGVLTMDVPSTRPLSRLRSSRTVRRGGAPTTI